MSEDRVILAATNDVGLARRIDEAAKSNDLTAIAVLPVPPLLVSADVVIRPWIVCIDGDDEGNRDFICYDTLLVAGTSARVIMIRDHFESSYLASARSTGVFRCVSRDTDLPEWKNLLQQAVTDIQQAASRNPTKRSSIQDSVAGLYT
jgi:hypothetical protein